MTSNNNLKNINYDNYDFIDMGCGTGTGYYFAQDVFGPGRGMGVDISEDKIQLAQKAIQKDEQLKENYTVICEDMLNFANVKNKFRYAMANHFLEHVDGFTAAKKILSAAINASYEFVFLRQPWFDHNSELFKLGLKTYYSDWTGHPNLLTTYDFYRMGRDFKLDNKISDFIILGLMKIKDSSDPIIHPLNSSFNDHEYKAEKHPPKNMNIQFNGLYREVCVFFMIDKNMPVEKYIKNLNVDYEVIYDSRQNQANIENNNIIDTNKLDFIDIGCGSKGMSLIFGVQKFDGLRGLGIDKNPESIKNLEKKATMDGSPLQSHRFLNENIFNLNCKDEKYYKKFRFTSAIHLLSTLKNMGEVREVICKCIDLSSDFIFLNNVNNDYNEYLESLGFRKSQNQTIKLTSQDYINILSKLKDEGLIVDFEIYALKLIENSSNPAITPLRGDVCDVEFDDVYSECSIFIQLCDNLDISKLTRRLVGLKKLVYSSKK